MQVTETLQVLSYHLDRECNRITLKEVNWPDTYPYRRISISGLLITNSTFS
ncbi:MAG: hypothetical protein ACLU4J_02275 [Butyricimonas paravirosa]